MADTGWLSPASFQAIADSGGGQTWSQGANTYSQNDTYATANIEKSADCDSLEVYNFGASVPAGATIDGVIFEVDRYQAGTDECEDRTARLVKAGTATGDDKVASGDWPTSDTDTYLAYGGASDDWNASLSSTDVNATTFGFRLGMTNISADAQAIIYIDHIRCKIYYTVAVSGSPWNYYAQQ